MSIQRTVTQALLVLAAFLFTFAVVFSLAANPQAPARPASPQQVARPSEVSATASSRPQPDTAFAGDVPSHPTDPAAVQTFEAVDRAGGDWYLHTSNDTGVLAWRGGYVLLAYVHMYEGTGQTRYLDKFVQHARAAVAMTDEARQVEDWQGRSLPAWRCGIGLTVADLKLANGRGKPVLRAISRYYNHNDHTTVKVVRSAKPETFGLIVQNDLVRRRPEVFANLSVDKSSSRYFGRTVNVRSRILSLESLVPTLQPGADTPRPTGPLRTSPVYYHVAVQTGMLAYPLARFAAVIKRDPALAPRYGRDGDNFLRAAERAVAVHEREWVDKGAYGYYAFRRGDPVWCDGIEMPLNEELVLGRAILQLYGATGSLDYRDRGMKMANMLKSRLRVDGNNAYVWNYWYGWGRSGWTPSNSPSANKLRYLGFKKIEDISHSSLTNDFASVAADLGIVMTKADKIRFANTFHANMRMAGGRIASNVLGSVTSPSESMEVWVNGWFGQASANRDVQVDAEGALARLLKRDSKGGLFLYAIARNIHARSVLANVTEPMCSPKVRVVSPAGSPRISGDTTMSVDVTGSISGGVKFFIDGSLAGVDGTRPFAMRLDTAGLPVGKHLLRAVAHDADGRTGAACVRVKVAGTTRAIGRPGR